MNIFITGYDFSYPNGAGASVRAALYAAGLKAAGASVQVLCLKPTEPPAGQTLNPQPSGVFQDVPFAYVCGQSRRRRHRLGNTLLYLKSLRRTASLLRGAARAGQPTALLAFSCDYPLYVAYLLFAARSARALLVGERNEFPLVYRQPGLRTRCARYWSNRHLFPRMDGMVVISSFLETHFRQMLGPDFPLLRVPILVDANQFAPSNPPAPQRLITYCGNFNHDGEIEALLDAFQLADAATRGWRLQLVGGRYGETGGAFVRHLAQRRGLQDAVIATGFATREQVPGLLLASDILVLLRKPGTFSTANFPTKLGEYLATGRPVVVTATGDIPVYLQDGVQAYLVAPGDTAAFAAKLRHLLDHPAEAAEVGRRGRELARAKFDCYSHGERLLRWLQDLARKKTT